MLAGQPDEPIGGVLGDTHQPPGLANATAIPNVIQEGDHLVGRQLGMVQGRALALGKPRLAGRTVNLADGLFPVDPSASGEISPVPLAVQGTAGILATELIQRPHRSTSLSISPSGEPTWVDKEKIDRIRLFLQALWDTRQIRVITAS
jgi:hypothetical protein